MVTKEPAGGFALRFRKVLDSKTPQWHELRMAEPVRWQPEDPLESFVFRTLLLNAVPAVIDKSENISPETVYFQADIIGRIDVQ